MLSVTGTPLWDWNLSTFVQYSSETTVFSWICQHSSELQEYIGVRVCKQLHNLGSATAKFQVRQRGTTTRFRSLCTHHWTLVLAHPRSLMFFDLLFACKCSSMYNVQCWAFEDKSFSFFFSADWRWQRWRTWYSAVAASIPKTPGVAYSYPYVLKLFCSASVC